MSDLWTLSPSSAHPIVHQSSLSHSLPAFSFPSLSPQLTQTHVSPFQFPQPQVTSPHLHQSQVTSPHLHQPQVTSPHLHQSQVTSPHLHQPQVTSPHLHQPQVTSPHLHQSQVTSPHLHQPQVTSPHLHQSQVTSPHLHQPQVTSPHLHQPQVTSPHHHQSQVTSPHLHQSQIMSPHLHQSQVTYPHLQQTQVTSLHLHQSQVTSLHLHQSQVTSPHLHQPQATSPHLHQPQVTSPHLHQPQATSPHLHQPQVTSPHLLHTQLMSPCLNPQTHVSSSLPLYKSQVTSPHHLAPPLIHSAVLPHTNVTSPHLMSQQLLLNQSPDPELDYTNWNKYESSDLSDYLSGNSFSYQNQPTAHLDHHLQAQNQFSTGDNHRDELENPNKPYNAHTPHVSDIQLSDMPGLGQHTWGHLVPTMSQQQCSPLGSVSDGNAVGRWNSIDLSSLSAQDFPSNQFFHEGYHDNNGPEPFSSPTTPGPSPHYPQIPAVSSPGPQMHPRTKKTGQQLPLEASKQFLLSQTEPVQEMMGLHRTTGSSGTSFSPEERGQKVSSAGPPLGPAAGMTPIEEYEGGRRGGRRGRDFQSPSTWVQPRSSTETRDSRLLCTVCKRDFRSLPALNGHMRSHSGFRSPVLVKKDISPPAQNPVSIVMPVSVPVQSRGMSLVRGGGQRRCSILPLVTRGSVLYRSMMRLEEKEGDAPKATEGGVVVNAGSAGHYTPPPMLCPLRAGPGLYCSLTTREQQRVHAVQLHNGLDDPVAKTTACPPPGTLASGVITPRINLGRSFQAEIPLLQDRTYTVSDSHNALLLWMPWDKLKHPLNQERVESLLTMARSSVVPGGGASPEHVLNILSTSKGDFLFTLEKLLTTPETSENNQTVVKWSPAEKKLLVKSLKLHQKDFASIQKAVQTKSLSECVEFYYLWKKKLSLSMRTQASLTVTLPDPNDQRSSKSQEAS
ncbi:transcriptional-regulating factor 1-like [Melanotaenia boesemani]|uniref:transcriptional-regulating factor 1-like n=1 Tax=Melanotaenia boesemani TaxID=1250792 RepID=UPI001C05E01B|nr:transcriptional-regulating factor 1-like [Melanotaenia boesemani]XP_041834686.1 transcriptional-regulating factor 1-like [Melanotaenia boesemani]